VPCSRTVHAEVQREVLEVRAVTAGRPNVLVFAQRAVSRQYQCIVRPRSRAGAPGGRCCGRTRHTTARPEPSSIALANARAHARATAGAGAHQINECLHKHLCDCVVHQLAHVRWNAAQGDVACTARSRCQSTQRCVTGIGVCLTYLQTRTPGRLLTPSTPSASKSAPPPNTHTHTQKGSGQRAARKR
jgi:hypothetical protein